VVKVREGLAPDDYKDPGWFKHPPGTVAYEYKGPRLGQAPEALPRTDRAARSPAKAVEVRAVKPKGSHRQH
jgi:hypothetical protein